MDRYKADEIREQVKDLLQPLEAEFSVKVQRIAGSFGSSYLKLTVDLGDDQGDGLPRDRFAEQLTSWAKYLGFDEDPVGRVFGYNGDVWTLTGYNRRAPRYPVLAVKKSDGKTYKLLAKALQAAGGKGGV